MVELRLLASDYQYCNKGEQSDRDQTAVNMVKAICSRYFNGTLENNLYLLVSFFSEDVYWSFMEYLEAEGIKALCGVNTGVDHVIRIRFEPAKSSLWTKF